MTIIEWKSEYDTGVEEMDNQHKVLVSLINELSDLVGDQFDRGAAEEVFNKLKNYTMFHFSTEERLMAQYHYLECDLYAHLKQHRQFESEIASVQHDFSQVSVEDCNVILSYLKNWLINHICKVDQRFAAIILAKRREEGKQTTTDDVVSFAVEGGEDIGHLSSLNDEGARERYLSLARDQMAGVEVMLSELEACFCELRRYCDELSGIAPEKASDEAYMHCVQGTYLVKSLQGKQIKLKEALSIIAQNSL